MPKRVVTPELREAVLKGRADGVADRELAAALGMKHSTVRHVLRVAREAGDPRAAKVPREIVSARISAANRQRWADFEIRCRCSEATKRAMSGAELRARLSESAKRRWAAHRGFAIPAWVDAAGLRRTFCRLARAEGEEAAAAFCRALKRQAAMAA